MDILGHCLRITLLPAALVRGAWACLRRRPIRDIGPAEGLRARFRFASMLAAAGLLALAGACSEGSSSCYAPPVPTMTRSAFMNVLGLLWRTLDPARVGAFRSATQEGVFNKHLDHATAERLAADFEALGRHRQRLGEGDPLVTCYVMSPFQQAQFDSHQRAMLQLQTLRDAVAKGVIPPDVAARAKEVLAFELGFEQRARALGGQPDPQVLALLLEAYRKGVIALEPLDRTVAGLVVELEGGPELP